MKIHVGGADIDYQCHHQYNYQCQHQFFFFYQNSVQFKIKFQFYGFTPSNQIPKSKQKIEIVKKKIFVIVKLLGSSK
jgi:hypothetical protein